MEITMDQTNKRPNFIIVGTMKGGTTRLYEFINIHPDVEAAKEKEIHYFSLHYHKGLEWYLEHFPSKTGKLTGEASTTYFHVADTVLVPNLIKSFNPDVKIILIVRDPIERAVSHYNHFCKLMKFPEVLSLEVNEFFNLSFSEAIARTTSLGFYFDQALSFSLYYRNLLNFEAVFGKKNILVLSNKNLRQSPFETMKRVYEFLDIHPVRSDEFKKVKYSWGTNIDVLHEKTFQRLAELFYPDFRKFCERTGIEYVELQPRSSDVPPHQGAATKRKESPPESKGRLLEESTSLIPENQKQKDVHVGNDGWLFLLKGTNKSVEYYQDPDLFSSQMVDHWINLLRARVKYFTDKNIRYVHLFAPNKLTIYPEHFRGELPFFGDSPLQKLYRILVEHEEKDVLDHVINPVVQFNKAKESNKLYWKTDTHWTFHGVFAAYQMICSKLGVTPNMDLLQRGKRKGHLILDEGSKLDSPVSEEVEFYDLLKDAKRVLENDLVKYKEKNKLEKTNMDLHVGSNVVFYNKAAPNPEKVILFGDSFSEYRPHLLTGVLAETFREVHFVWSVSLDFEYIEKAKPDIVITEIVERFMPQVPADTFNLEKYCRSKLGDKKLRDKFREFLQSVKRVRFG
jgi:alginate O-acetyltransferase complex protein AlgJ